MKTSVLLIAQLLCCATAFADANIVVDGVNTDWAATTSCFFEPAGDVTGGVDLNRSCMENNNTTGDVGQVFLLFQNANVTQNLRGSSFGWQFDKNQDGVFDANDEIWYVTVPATGTTFTDIIILNPTNFAERRRYSTQTDCGGSPTSNGWSAAWVNNVVELSIAYGCIGWSAGNDNRLVQVGAYQPLDTSAAAWYDGAAGTVTPPGTPANVLHFTVASGPGRNTLTWTNPAQHQGVLIVRRTGSAVTFAPSNLTEYTTASNLGNGDSVVYVDGNTNAVVSNVSSWTDTSVIQPTTADVRTRYFYKVFNHHQARTYAAGNVPTTAGLFGEPTLVTRPVGWNGPHWCFSTGLASYVQPTQRRDVGVYAPGNLAAIVATNTVRTSQANDGLERFRPVSINASIQDRFSVTTAGGVSAIFTGDQSGRMYAFSSDTGSKLSGWVKNNGDAPLSGASSIQTTPVFQARALSSPAAQAVMPSDLVFVATRNSSATTNRIYALNAATGDIVWIGPKNATTGALMNMDIVSGVPWVEYDATGINRLWVGSRSNNNTQPSLWILDSLTGNVIQTISIPGGALAGGVDLPIFRDNTLKQMVLVDNNGNVRGYSLTTLAQVWTVALGGSPASFPYTVGGTFFITRKRTSATETGRLYRYQVVNNVATVMAGWPRQIPDPSYPTVDFTAGQQRVYVGSSDGLIYSVDINNGNLKTVRVGASGQQLGSIGIDTMANRVHVYGAEGRVCAFSIPFN